METRNIEITLDKAREWYNSGNTTLKELALQIFNRDELLFNFKNITSFKEACNALNLNYNIISIIVKDVATYSRASAAMFKLNIIRKALNLGHNLSFSKGEDNTPIYAPYNPIVRKDCYHYKEKINSHQEIIGKIKTKNLEYYVFSDYDSINNRGLGCFVSENLGVAYINAGLLGCATKEIAEHFSKYFGMLITEAKYGDLLDFKVVERKYN